MTPRSQHSQHQQNVPLFSRIMYPSHDAQTRPPSPSTPDESPPDDDAVPPFGVTVDSVCESLKISRVLHDKLYAPLSSLLRANGTHFSVHYTGPRMVSSRCAALSSNRPSELHNSESMSLILTQTSKLLRQYDGLHVVQTSSGEEALPYAPPIRSRRVGCGNVLLCRQACSRHW